MAFGGTEEALDWKVIENEKVDDDESENNSAVHLEIVGDVPHFVVPALLARRGIVNAALHQLENGRSRISWRPDVNEMNENRSSWARRRVLAASRRRLRAALQSIPGIRTSRRTRREEEVESDIA